MIPWQIEIEPRYEDDDLAPNGWRVEYYGWQATGIVNGERVYSSGYANSYDAAVEQAHHYADNVTMHEYTPNRNTKAEHTEETHDG